MLFIDHSSSDSTAQLIETFISGHPNAELIFESDNNVAQSRQKIVNSCKTKWLAFVDSDVILPDCWLEKAVHFAQSAEGQSQFAGVSGPLIIKPLYRNLANIHALQNNFVGHARTEQLSPSRATRQASHLPTSAVLFSVACLMGTGGFRPDLCNCGEDLELGTRLKKLGYSQWVCPELEVKHLLSCRTLGQWYQRAFRFGRARIRVAMIHPQMWTEIQVAIPISLISVQLIAFFVGLISNDHFGILSGVILMALHFAFVFMAFFTFRNFFFSLKTAWIAWTTHMTYAYGEFYELLQVPVCALQKKILRTR